MVLDVFIPVTPNPGDGNEGNHSAGAGTDASQYVPALNSILFKYKGIVLGVFGMATLTLLALAIYFAVQLGSTGNNPMKRQQASSRLVLWGIATAIMGSFTLFFGLAFNFFK